MKVITQPEPKKLWSTTVTCIGHRGVRLGCGATVEVAEDDLFRVDRSVTMNSTITKAHAEMECPICHVWSDVTTYPQPEVLPEYGAWKFLMGQPEDEVSTGDPVETFHREMQKRVSYELSGYYAAPLPQTYRTIPENLEPSAKQHLWFMTAGNSQ